VCVCVSVRECVYYVVHNEGYHSIQQRNAWGYFD